MQRISDSNFQRGQALLIVVLVMVIALTVGLSLVSRSITNLRSTTEQENSQRAFSAAEAGVEQALKIEGTGALVPERTFTENNATIESVNVQEVKGSNFLLYGGNNIVKNDGADIWLSDYSTDSNERFLNAQDVNVRILWGESATDCSNAGMDISVITTTDTGNPRANAQIIRYAYDPCSTRRSVNSLSSPTDLSSPVSIGNVSFYQSIVIPVQKGLLIRIAPIFQNAKIGVQGYTYNASGALDASKDLPPQGRLIDSVGSAGDTKRKVRFFQGYPALPVEFFPYALFCARPASDTLGSSCNF